MYCDVTFQSQKSCKRLSSVHQQMLFKLLNVINKGIQTGCTSLFDEIPFQILLSLCFLLFFPDTLVNLPNL